MKTFRVKQRIEAMSVGKRFERGAVINEATLPRELMASLFEDGVIELLEDEIKDELPPWAEEPVAEKPGMEDGLDVFDLTQIPGIGPKIAEKLIDAEFVELEDVANAEVEELTAVGIRESVAVKIIKASSEILGETLEQLVGDKEEDLEFSEGVTIESNEGSLTIPGGEEVE